MRLLQISQVGKSMHRIHTEEDEAYCASLPFGEGFARKDTHWHLDEGPGPHKRT